jgi:hypothetical protein
MDGRVCSERGKFFEHLVTVLELIEPIINTQKSLDPNYSNTITPLVKRAPKLVKTKKYKWKGKGL